MSTTTKRTLVSVATLFVIAFLASVILTLLNVLLPGPPPLTLGERETAILREIMPADSFVVVDNADQISAFNSQFGSNSDAITMAVRAQGGQSDGKYAVRVSSQGFNTASRMDILVAYDSDVSILGMRVLNDVETVPGGNQAYNRQEFLQAFVGRQGNISIGSIAASGATASANSIIRGVNLATAFAVHLYAVPPEWSNANASETALLRQLVGDQQALFTRASSSILQTVNVIQQHVPGLVNVFVQRTGQSSIIVETEGNGGGAGFGHVSVMATFEGSGAASTIGSIGLGTINSASDADSTDTMPPDNNLSVFVPREAIRLITNDLTDRTRAELQGVEDSFRSQINDFDPDVGIPPSGGTVRPIETLYGLIRATRAGFDVHDALDRQALLDALSEVPMPSPTFGTPSDAELQQLRQLTNSNLGFVKADNVFLTYNNFLNAANQSLVGVYVALTESVSTAHVVLEVRAIYQSRQVGIFATFDGTGSGRVIRAVRGTVVEFDDITPQRQDALIARINDSTQSQLSDVDFELDENSNSYNIESMFVEQLVVAAELAFGVNILNHTAFVQMALEPRWGEVTPVQLAILRRLHGSNIFFAKADARMLMHLGAMSSTSAQALGADFRGVFVALDGSGAVYIESEGTDPDTSNPPIGNRMSLMARFAGNVHNRRIENIAEGSVGNFGGQNPNALVVDSEGYVLHNGKRILDTASRPQHLSQVPRSHTNEVWTFTFANIPYHTNQINAEISQFVNTSGHRLSIGIDEDDELSFEVQLNNNNPIPQGNWRTSTQRYVVNFMIQQLMVGMTYSQLEAMDWSDLNVSMSGATNSIDALVVSARVLFAVDRALSTSVLLDAAALL